MILLGMAWIFLVLLYGLLKGSREIAKKLAMNSNSVMEVLVVYTLLSFIFVIPQAPNAGGLEPKYYFYIAIKSFCIFVAWICSFRSLKKLPVSLYGILDLSRVLFATFFGLVFLKETLSLWQIIGLVIVCTGLLMLKFKPKRKIAPVNKNPKQEISTTDQNLNSDVTSDSKNVIVTSNLVQNSNTIANPISQTIPAIYVILALASCVLNAVSGFLDKVLMKDMNSSQLQFWYMLFLVAYYLLYVLIKKEKITKSVWKNKWVWILAIMFVIGDKALFIANGMPGSRITVMTLIKQSGCLVTILGGRFIFKEKNIGYRLLCALIIIAGIVIGVQ